MIKKRWLLVVLISSVQLALLLAAVIYGSSWLDRNLTEIVQKQVTLSNAQLLNKASERIGGDTAATANRLRAEQMLQEVAVGDDQLLAVYSDGQWLAGNRTMPRLLDDFRQEMADRHAEFLVSECQLDNGLVVVAGQLQADYLSSIWQVVAWLRTLGFGLTLLVGLISTSLMVSVLQRYDRSLSADREELQAVVDERSLSLMRTKNAIIFGLAKIAESRDTDTGEHLDRIGKYVTLLADRLRKVYREIDDVFIADLALASSLHDIGKVGIPDSILLKPGRLTSDERFVMEQHTVIGGECLEAIEKQLGEDSFLEMARNIAYAHHERWDGKGYPYRLTNENIPLAARITSVADVYDALTTKRPYKKAMSHEESREIILAGKGTQFDPAVVDAFLAAEEDFQIVAARQSDNQIPALLSLENIVAIQASSIQSPSAMA